MGRRGDTDTYLRRLGQAVRVRRGQLQLSQEELGFRSDLDRTYISGIERGVRNPTVQTILALARALKTRPSELHRAAERKG